MLKLIAPAFAASLVAAPGLAATTCNFNVECYMTEACAGSGWEMTVDLAAGKLSSAAEDLDILHVAEGGAQIVAQGAGSLNLLSIGETLSLFTTHIAGEPTAITYVGECSAQ